ncbi:hypothetical protein [Polaribacter cellanae]|uniref:Uncharacterized protein n=1 Tax=Polaribacter cellanae TaxID=2818493 RepID=A0A975H7G4_9FLAO|nr:hypothetical protein [Polaribacter cellanae]QTE23491.1 hypothetical protein J3359_04205 [Polaribacter cellanae]
MIVFLLPIAVNSVHDFLEHEHKVCISKVESHVHKKDIDCNLHLLKQGNTFLVEHNFEVLLNTVQLEVNFPQYNFKRNHLQLSFSLRGPPSVI